jgi:hypothetical protein
MMADHDYDQNETQQPPADPLADAVEKIQFASPEEVQLHCARRLGEPSLNNKQPRVSTPLEAERL